MKTFVIADTHFGDANIIRFCNRPFRTVEEMDETMIKLWNETVTHDDTVIHLGDFASGSANYIWDVAHRLNGKKILILGNHDGQLEGYYRACGFRTVSSYPILYENFYLMSHAPLQLSETTPYYNCYGHIHNDTKYMDNSTSKCFSVERIGYRPALLFGKD